jgi:hypothetical protein
MLGMIPGNGHPYSWSAIINGFDKEAMSGCPYPAIPAYLGKQPPEQVRIEGARVTHLWTDNPAEAAHVAQAAKIPHIVSRPEDVLGHVDAAIISVDDGDDHVRRARPFIEAGLPVFIDKPLAMNVADLAQFGKWIEQGKPILSSSGMRYAPELPSLERARRELGPLHWATSVTCKTWERYGIHALEAIYPLFGPGFLDVKMSSNQANQVATLRHRCGAQVTISVLSEALGSFGTVHLYGAKGQRAYTLSDTYTAFRAQLVAFVEFVRSGVSPIPYAETREMMLALIAGLRSREQGGALVPLAAIEEELALLPCAS